MKKNVILMNLVVLILLLIFPLPGATEAANPEGNTQKEMKCPSKVSVVLETVQPAVFSEYLYLSGPAKFEVVAVVSPVAGIVSEIKISEGSLVEAGQELAVLNAGSEEKINALEQETANKKKILTARQNWKVKSEKAIQNAERDYKAALALLEESKALAKQIIQAPLAGMARIRTAVGSPVSQQTLLFEIVDPLRLRSDVTLRADEADFFTVGEKLSGTAEGFDGALEMEIVAVSENQVGFRVDNSGLHLHEGTPIRCQKLKAQYAEAIVIPTAAIQHDGLGDFVYAAERKKAKKMYVTGMVSAADSTMIEKGIVAGTQIILSGFECLAEGKKIRVTNQEQIDREKAEIQAQFNKQQAEAAAKKELQAKKEEDKRAKAAAKKELQSKKEEPAGAARKECPKKISVLTELTKQETFREYGYYPAPAEREAVAVASPAIGWIFALQATAGSRVEQGEELLTLISGESEKIVKLRSDVARKMKLLLERQGAKVKNERAIQAAERDLQKSLSQLETEVAPYARKVQAPVSGVVQSVQVVAGADVSESDVLMEIITDSQLLVTLPLPAAESGRFTLAETVSGKVAGQDAAWDARVIAVQDTQVMLRVDNAAGQIRPGSLFTVRKLKAEYENAIAVQSNALLQDGLGDFVYVAEKKKAKKVYVIPGASEAGRTLIEKGLAADMPIIVSGFECLSDKKKIRVLNEEQMAREKAALSAAVSGMAEFITYLEANKEALGYERYEKTEWKGQPAVKILSGRETQKKILDAISGFAVSDVTFELQGEWIVSTIAFKQAEAIGAGEEKPVSERAGFRLQIGVHGSYFMMLNKNFKDAYGGLIGFGGELSFRFSEKMDFWVSGGMANKNVTPDWSTDAMQFKLIPLAAAVRYYLSEKAKMGTFVGAGVNVFLVKDLNPALDIKTTLIGFHALGGLYYDLTNKLSVQFMAKFNMAKKDMVPESDLDDPLDLMGLQMLIGLSYSL